MMRIGKHVRILAGLVLMGVAGLALADESVPVIVLGSTDGVWNCSEATAERARWLADRALREGAYQRAGECYLAAGEHHLANEAFVKASAQAGEDTSRRLAANLSDLKAQAQHIKQAFQRR